LIGGKLFSELDDGPKLLVAVECTQRPMPLLFEERTLSLPPKSLFFMFGGIPVRGPLSTAFEERGVITP